MRSPHPLRHGRVSQSQAIKYKMGEWTDEAHTDIKWSLSPTK
jgi:hypothetical protein